MKKDIIDLIKDERLAPIPRWRYTIQKIFVWTGFISGILIGAISFSVILFAIQQSEFNVLEHIQHSRVEMILGILPFIWIVSLILFLLLSLWSIRNSWKGYKFPVYQLVLINTAISILLGTLFFISGGAERLEKQFSIQVEMYKSIEERKAAVWQNPSEGMLAGDISYLKGNEIGLVDLKGNNWTIDIEHTTIANIVLMEKGERIKLTGKKTSTSTFKAEQIRPWGGMGKRNR